MAFGYSKLGRNMAQRKALLRDLVTDLIIYERIETTGAKANELKRLADRMVTLGKRGDLAARRLAARLVRFEKDDKGQYAIQKLFSRNRSTICRSKRWIHKSIKTWNSSWRCCTNGDY